ncbi:DIP13 [Symbiodinium natans]|uniref:DIP13 protein n=1 Tax=Symbiodinium natans TaxID=878477 RepID=A0A812K2Y3_9DINO|nr:DIP13 [Symbiodinium natans]
MEDDFRRACASFAGRALHGYPYQPHFGGIGGKAAAKGVGPAGRTLCIHDCDACAGNAHPHPDNSRCPSCGHAWSTLEPLPRCARCSRILMDCDDCLERLPELESYCRFCLTGRYTQTLPIALFVERPQGGAGFWVTCRHLSGAEVLTMQVDEDSTVAPVRTAVNQMLQQQDGSTAGQDAPTEEQLLEWGAWHREIHVAALTPWQTTTIAPPPQASFHHRVVLVANRRELRDEDTLMELMRPETGGRRSSPYP